MATMKRQNITLEPEVYKKFTEFASKKGIKLSPWINSKMKDFIEEEAQNMDTAKFQEIKEQKIDSLALLVEDGKVNIGLLNDMKFLIETIENQQKEIEELQNK